MLELGSSGSMRGVSSNGHPYRDPRWITDVRQPRDEWQGQADSAVRLMSRTHEGLPIAVVRLNGLRRDRRDSADRPDRQPVVACRSRYDRTARSVLTRIVNEPDA